MNFIIDRLGVLHLHEEALVSAPVGGAPSIGSGTHDDFNDEEPALHFEQTLCSNPAVSNVHAVIHSIYYLLPILWRDTAVPTATAIRPTPLRPRVSHGRVCLGAPKDADAASSHIRIRGDGELCSHLFLRPHG